MNFLKTYYLLCWANFKAHPISWCTKDIHYFSNSRFFKSKETRHTLDPEVFLIRIFDCSCIQVYGLSLYHVSFHSILICFSFLIAQEYPLNCQATDIHTGPLEIFKNQHLMKQTSFIWKLKVSTPLSGHQECCFLSRLFLGCCFQQGRETYQCSNSRFMDSAYNEH